MILTVVISFPHLAPGGVPAWGPVEGTSVTDIQLRIGICDLRHVKTHRVAVGDWIAAHVISLRADLAVVARRRIAVRHVYRRAIEIAGGPPTSASHDLAGYLK